MKESKWLGTKTKPLFTLIITLQFSIAFSCHSRYQCPYWAWEETENIVIAKVTSIDTTYEQLNENHWLYGRYDSIPMQEYTIRVKKNIKGNLAQDNQKIVTDINEGACDQMFDIANTYIIYLHDHHHFEFYTSNCERNTRRIKKELEALKTRKNNEEQCGIWRKRQTHEK